MSAHKSNASHALLWKRYFMDPSQWHDYRKTKIRTMGPDFLHKTSKEPLWVEGDRNLFWVFEELSRTRKVRDLYEENEISSDEHAEAVASVEILKVCARKKDLMKGTSIHSDILKKGLLDKFPYLGSALVSMYAKCSALVKARRIHDELPVRNIVSWNALISGYAQQGHAEEALNCYDLMKKDGFSPDVITYTCILKASANAGAIEKGAKIHEEIVKNGFLRKDALLGTALVDMYAKCGELGKASQVFDELLVRDVVAWNALIAGYAQQGQSEEALNCFERMESDGVSPNVITFTCILKACGNIGEIEKGKQIHDEISSKGLLRKDCVLGTALVDMYAKCGQLKQAQQVFDELLSRDAVSWNTLIAGYVQQGQAGKAFYYLDCMRTNGFSPDAITFSCMLKACGSIKALDKGKEIHEDIVSTGFLERHTVLGNSLVDMYAKCGELVKAQQVFDELLIQDVVSWNSLITGYSQQGQYDDALNCFERMQHDNISPNTITFISILKVCGSVGAVDVGKRIHDDLINKRMQENDSVLGTALVDMYAKCGELGKAEEIFEELPVRDVVTWSALITGYVNLGWGQKALNVFDRMQNEGLSADAVTFVCIMKACGSEGTIHKGKQIHNIIINGVLLEKDSILGNALVDMYAKCGQLQKAQKVFEELPSRTVVSWNSLIAGYVQQEQHEEALICFEKMQTDGISPNAITFTSTLKACGGAGALQKGENIHDVIVKKNLLEKHVVLGNALVDMYVKCGALGKAQKILDELPIRDVISWSAVIAGYARQERGQDALQAFEQMQNEGISPDTVTFTCILKACGTIRSLDKGKRIHEQIMSQGLWGKDAALSTALVDMYAKCGELDKAQKVFQQLSNHGVVLWNALISGYAQQGWAEDAFKCFEKMQNDGLSPNEVTFVSIIKACGSAGALEKGKRIHDELENRGLLEKYSILGNSLVDMYAKCGELEKAQQVFEKLPLQDLVSWNALITGCIQQGRSDDALNYFECMQKDGISPDVITFTSILKACGNKGAVDKGKQIHDEIVNKELLQNHVALGNALIDMYAKCGMLQNAQQVFDELPIRDVVSWNALISGYAEQGQGDEALGCFKQMQSSSVSPDSVTLLCVLTACSHSGLVKDGQFYFAEMCEKYGITPDIKHETCMVDLFGRAGLFENAMALIRKMQSSDYPIWCVLLGACEKWGNVKLGKLAFEQAVQLDNITAGAYTCMANIYAAAGLEENAERIQAMRKRIALS